MAIESHFRGRELELLHRIGYYHSVYHPDYNELGTLKYEGGEYFFYPDKRERKDDSPIRVSSHFVNTKLTYLR